MILRVINFDFCNSTVGGFSLTQRIDDATDTNREPTSSCTASEWQMGLGISDFFSHTKAAQELGAGVQSWKLLISQKNLPYVEVLVDVYICL